MKVLTEERKKLLWELLRDVGMDTLFFLGLPWVKGKLGKPVTAEDREVAQQTRDHIAKGEYNEARKVLTRHLMGFGLYDEEMFDEDLAAVRRARLAKPAQLRRLEAWLKSDQRKRSRFRNSLTLQETPQARMEVIAEYANMKTDVERDTRLEAVGKLDDSFDEAIWNWVKIHVPGMSRSAWDALYNGTSTVVTGFAEALREIGVVIGNTAVIAGQGIGTGARIAGNGIVQAGGVIRNTALTTNARLNAGGLRLQAAYPPPAPARRGRFMRWVSRMWQTEVNSYR